MTNFVLHEKVADEILGVCIVAICDSIGEQNMQDFQSLGLSKQLLLAIEQEGYTTPTPVQAQAIPPLLNGNDVLGVAQTGTCLLYTSPSPRDLSTSRMPSSA